MFSQWCYGQPMWAAELRDCVAALAAPDGGAFASLYCTADVSDLVAGKRQDALRLARQLLVGPGGELVSRASVARSILTWSAGFK